MAAYLFRIGRAGSLKCFQLQRSTALPMSPTAALATDSAEPKKPGKKAGAATAESDERASQFSNKTVVAFPSKIVLPEVPRLQVVGGSMVTETPVAPTDASSSTRTTAEKEAVASDDISKTDTRVSESGAADEGGSTSSSSDSDSDSDDEKGEVKTKSSTSAGEVVQKEGSSQGWGDVPAASQAPSPARSKTPHSSAMKVPPHDLPGASPHAGATREGPSGVAPVEVSEVLHTSRMKAVDVPVINPEEASRTGAEAASVRAVCAVPVTTSGGPSEHTVLVSATELEKQGPASVTLEAASQKLEGAVPEDLVDAAPLVTEAAGAESQHEAHNEAEAVESPQEAAPPPPEPEPFDNSTYKNLQHHQYHSYTFVDMELEMAKYRLPQPSSGRPSPRH